MPINACSINAYTIDGRCRRAKSPVIPEIHAKPRSIPKLIPGYSRWRPEDEVDVSQLESSVISCAITLGGETFNLAIDAKELDYSATPLVQVRNLRVTGSTFDAIVENLRVINSSKLPEEKP